MVKMYYFLLILLNVCDGWVLKFPLCVTAYKLRTQCPRFCLFKSFKPCFPLWMMQHKK